MPKSSASRGRPPVVSREMLQDAAFELFLEQGYEHTTVEHIANRAGVGRSTFFNHFGAKSDVFWIELDDAADILERELARQMAEPDDSARDGLAGLDGIRHAITAVGETWGPESVPFVLTQQSLIGSAHDLQASAVARLTQHASLVAGFLEHSGQDADRARVIAYTVVAASVAAASNWAGAGTRRGELSVYLDAAISPLLTGFAT